MGQERSERTTQKAAHTGTKKSSYVYGNAVRRVQTAPEYAPERQPQKPLTREEQIALHQRRRAAKRNKERELAMNRGYVVFLMVATIICGIFAAGYVHYQSEITTSMMAVSAMENQISDLKIENDATEKRIETMVSLDDVKAKALKLGMQYPAEKQIQYFSVTSTDYMNQYSDIPE